MPTAATRSTPAVASDGQSRAWIFAGNLAERISRRVGEEDVWTELIGIRNVYAHYTPSAISYDRVWFDAAPTSIA